MARLLRGRDSASVEKARRAAPIDDETRLELSTVALVVGLMALIALILVGIWLGGVWTGVIIVGVPLVAIAALFTWGVRNARASDREEAHPYD
jgi:fatty acid desaturase